LHLRHLVNPQTIPSKPKKITLTGGGGFESIQQNHQIESSLREQIVEMSNTIKRLNSEEDKARIQAQIKYYEYLNKKAEINLSQYRWQQTASNYLLFLVMVVVLSGIFFSGYQIWKSSSIKDISSDSTIELSIQKIKVTSSVVGVIVLAISIVFLYFFLIEVYRIKVVDMSKSEMESYYTDKKTSCY